VLLHWTYIGHGVGAGVYRVVTLKREKMLWHVSGLFPDRQTTWCKVVSKRLQAHLGRENMGINLFIEDMYELNQRKIYKAFLAYK
jgi:Uri superfamily endonuclease